MTLARAEAERNINIVMEEDCNHEEDICIDIPVYDVIMCLR